MWLCGWESQSVGEIARKVAGEAGRATPHWAPHQAQESRFACPAAPSAVEDALRRQCGH